MFYYDLPFGKYREFRLLPIFPNPKYFSRNISYIFLYIKCIFIFIQNQHFISYNIIYRTLPFFFSSDQNLRSYYVNIVVDYYWTSPKISKNRKTLASASVQKDIDLRSIIKGKVYENGWVEKNLNEQNKIRLFWKIDNLSNKNQILFSAYI